MFVHEFGHLLAFRLIGQPWGRMVFLPFLGALAVPRYSFADDGQHVFAALMGPAFGLAAALPGLICLAQGIPPPHALASLAFVAALLNLFNLLPVPPLDGGLATRALARRLFGARGHIAMVVIGVALALVTLPMRNWIVTGLCLLAAAAALRPAPLPEHFPPLTWRGFAAQYRRLCRPRPGARRRSSLPSPDTADRMGISADYQEAVRSGALKPDAAQQRIVAHLARLEAELQKPAPSLLSRLFETAPPPRGLYIQGAVGRGKTMLMDMFFAAVAIDAEAPRALPRLHAGRPCPPASRPAARTSERDAPKPASPRSPPRRGSSASTSCRSPTSPTR